VKRVALLLCIMMSMSACETSTDPLDGIINGGGSITPSQASGNWTFTLQRTTDFACTGALASGQTINTFLDVSADGTLTTASSWQNPISAAVQQLTGTVGLNNGAVTLTFAAGGGRAMELTAGTMTSAGSVTSGSVIDPSAGFAQVFGSDACRYSATAVKTG
jgi:hypothetical protein